MSRAAEQRRTRVLILVGVVVAVVVAGSIGVLAGRAGKPPTHSSAPPSSGRSIGSLPGTSPAGSAGTRVVLGAFAWRLRGLKILAGPVADDGVILVTVVGRGNMSELEAVSATTGRLLWTSPDAQSFITLGVPLEPAATHGIAIDLAPVRSESSGLVTPEGLSVTSGQVMWSSKPMTVLDAPVLCPGGTNFCVDGESEGTTLGIFALSATTGTLVRFQPGPVRSMGGNIYEDSATSPTFDGIDSAGRLSWTRTVASIFGGPNFNPDYGWDVNEIDNVDIGYVGVRTSATAPSENLAAFRTVGISPTTGATLWEDPGMFDCGGAVELTVTYLCRLTGTLHKGAKPKPMAVVVEGVDTATGHVTWKRTLADGTSLLDGKAILASPSSIVAPVGHDHTAVIDLGTGAVSPAPRHLTAWCVGAVHTVKIVRVKGEPHSTRRVAQSTAKACSVSGRTVSGEPTHPWFGGAETRGLFVWPTPGGGLEAVHTNR